MNKYSFLLIGIFVFILLAASLFTAQYIYSSPFTRNSASSIYAYRLNNIQKNEGSVLGIMGKKNETSFENLMFGNRKSGMAGFYLSDKNGVEMKLEVDKKIQNGEVMPVTSKGKDGEAIVTYEDIAKDTDLIYKTTTSQIKEEIIINTREAAENTESYTFNLNIEGLSYQKNEDDTVIPTFTSIKDKETTYTIPPAFMIDSKGAKSYGVTTKITEDSTNPNNLIIELTPNKSWLTSDDRQFPIIIDPTLIKGNPPILSLNFDEGNGQTTQDGSTSNNDGTLGATSGAEASDPTWKPDQECISGKCLRFDGTDDYVNAGSANSLDDVGVITISAWIKPNSYGEGNYGRIVDKGLSTGATYGRGFFLCNDGGVNCNAGSISFFQNFDGTDGWWSTPANSIPLNTWTHVTVIYDRSSASNNPVIYINGKEQTVTENTSPSGNARSDASYNLYVGSRLNDDRTFLGLIDEVRIYNYARTSIQVRQDYTSRGTVMGTAVQFGSDTNRKLSDGLVGMWKLDEGTSTTANDSSGNSLTGTLAGAVTWVSGKYGYGVNFTNTSGDYINVADNNVIDFGASSDFTLSAWVKRTTATEQDAILNKKNAEDSCSSDPGYSFYISTAGNPTFWGCDSSNNSYKVQSDTTISTGAWYHITAVWDDDSTANTKVYINGQPTTSTTTGTLATVGDLTNALSLRIGSETDGGQRMNGVIDDVRIYSKALSAGEAQSLYNNSPGPFVYYDFNENSGTSTVYDKSGNGYTGTMYGSMTDADWVTGKYGSALNFDATDDFIDISSAVGKLNESAGTMMAWVKPRVTQSHTILTSGASAGGSHGIFFDTNVNVFRVSYRNDGWAAEGLLQSAITFSGGDWHHLATTWSANSFSLYVDGVLQESEALTQQISNQDFIVVGAYASEYVAPEDIFDGDIDEVKLYDYVRTQGQIVEDMNGGHPVGGSPVGSQVGYWKFNEGYGDTVYDWSPQSLDGDLAGSGGSCPGAANCPTWTSSGKFGKALSFDGSNDFVNVGDVINTSGNTPMSLSAWVNVTALPGTDGKIVSKYNDGVTGEWYLSVNSNGTVGFLRECGSYGTSSTAVLSTSTWYHLAGVYDGTNLKIYINGKLNKTATDSCSTSNTAADVYIGADDSNTSSQRNLNAIIDEVKIYATSLTDDQVRTEYLGGVSNVMGAKSTLSDGKTADFSASREYCVPGDTSTCNAPVAVWNLDEKTGTSTNDISGNNHNCSFQSMPTEPWVVGKVGSALDFQKTDDGVNCGNTFTNFTALSISAWIKPRTSSTYEQVITKANDASPTNGWLFEMNLANDSLEFWGGTSGSTVLRIANNVIVENQWQHVGVTWDGSTTATNIKLYVNGKETTYTTTTNGSGTKDNESAQNMLIGLASDNNDDYDGYIDQVRVYNYVRTPSQMTWDYNRGAPVAQYKFDECTGTVIKDWAKNANGTGMGSTGTLNLGASGETNSGNCTTTGAWFSGANGQYGASIDLDGTDDYISVANNSTLNPGNNFSMSAWVNLDTNAYQQFVNKQHSGGNVSPHWGVIYRMYYNNSTSTFDCQVFNGTGHVLVQSPSGMLQTDTWQHVTCTLDGSNLKLFLNGKQVGATAFTGSVPTTDTGTLYIGARTITTTSYLNGQIDDVRIYNYPLTQAQVNTSYNEGAAVKFK